MLNDKFEMRKWSYFFIFNLKFHIPHFRVKIYQRIGTLPVIALLCPPVISNI